ncbi:von Willebrand factor type A domain-containing protein [Haloferula chungangensis]|uniref:von Willebrand factor type A domain-containing protein n=1 Tax=Haloferula chungangensis TaxID=1048331 RepID=A0ABW2L363_9BACT
MKDEPRKPLEALGDEALEARIVAWVLGEASAFEAAELEERCANDADLNRFAERMREVHRLIEADGKLVEEEEWKLPDVKRRKVVDLLGVEPVVRLEKRRFTGRRILLAFAACVMATLMALPLLLKRAPVLSESKTIVSYMAPSAPADGDVIRNFNYPTDYEPPDLQDSIVGYTSNERSGSPVTPATPSRLPASKPASALVDFTDVPVDQPFGNDSDLAGAQTGDPFSESGAAGMSGDGKEVRLKSESLIREELAKNESQVQAGKDSNRSRVLRTELIDDLGETPSSVPEMESLPALGHLFAGEGKKQAHEADSDSSLWMERGDRPLDATGAEFVTRVHAGGLIDMDGFSGEHLRLGGVLYSDSGRSSESLWGGRASDLGLESENNWASRTKTYTGFSQGGIDEEESIAVPYLANPDRLSLGFAYTLNGVDRQDMVEAFDGLDSSVINGGLKMDLGLMADEGRVGGGTVAEAKPTQVAEGYSSLAQRETMRRASVVVESDRKRDEAREAYANGRYAEAQQKYQESIEILPDAPLLDERRIFLQKSLADAEVARSLEAKRLGQYDEARELLESAKKRDPENQYALDALAALDDPIRSNAAALGNGEEKLGEVRRGLYHAEGAFELGKFDEAEKQYAEVIRKDPYNTAARRGLERVNAAKSDYYRASYDQARAELLMEVDKSWELAVPEEEPVIAKNAGGFEGEVHVGYENMYEFRFADLDGSIAPETHKAEKSPGELADDSLSAAEQRLKGLKKGVGQSVIEAAKHPRVSDESQQELARLRDEVQKQEDAVEDKRKTLTTILRNQELIYRGLNNGGGREGGYSGDGLEAATKRNEELKKNAVQQGIGIHGFEEAKSEFEASEAKLRALKLDLLDREVGNGDGRLAGLEDALQKQRDAVEDKRKTLTTILRNQELIARGKSNLSPEEVQRNKKQKAVQQGIGLHGFDDAAAELETSERLLKEIEMRVDELKEKAAIDAAIEAGEPIPKQELKPKVVSPELKDNSATLDAMAEISAADEAFSTFSMHVSDASFKLAAAAMERGEVPAAESVRPEEFYNAFDYGDPAPTANEPVACAVEQCAHPAFPQRNLLRIAVRTGAEGRAQSKPLNLTLLLDNSGSMEREDRALGLNRAVEGLTSLLKEGDTVTVAGFSRQPRLLADRVDGEDAVTLNGLVTQTPAEGGTNLEEALNLGGELAKRQFKEGAQNRVVLFTDGAANLGDADPESLNGKVEQLRNEGIAFDAAGFGADGLNDRLLERLTRNGNGRYYVVDDAEDADQGFAEQLAGAFRPAAENVKVQVVFNPSRVGNYKLIGFEEHRLKKEDFRNDAVDAAEMASEEAGVALYQFEVLPEGQGEVGEVSIRFRDTATGEMVEQSWPIPYDPQAPSFDQAKPGIQLAGIAAFVAEKLRGAPLAEAVDYSQLRGVMARVKAEYHGNERVAQLERMMRR